MITYNEKGKVTMNQQEAEKIRLMELGIKCSHLEETNHNAVLFSLILESAELKISEELPQMAATNPTKFCKTLLKRASRLAPHDWQPKKGCIELVTPYNVRMTQDTARKLDAFLEGLSNAFEVAGRYETYHSFYVATVLEEIFFNPSLGTAQWKIADHEAFYSAIRSKIFELCPDLKAD